MPTGFSDLSAAELEARGATWTAREIAQQPVVWPQIEALLADERKRLDAFLGPLLADHALRIVLSGAGTSAFIGDCLAPALSACLHRPVEAIATTDLVAGPWLHLDRAAPILLVSFARSGNSPESVAAVDLEEQSPTDVHHLIVTCNADGALAGSRSRVRHACVLTLPDATHDRGFAMTSSFTSMLLAAALAFGLVTPPAVAPLARAAATTLQTARSLSLQLATRGFTRVVYLGSNELRGLAAEAALKLLELSDGRTVAIADSVLGFRHGPKTIIDAHTLVVVMLSNNPYTRAYDLDLLRELRRDARAGGVLALTARPDGAQDGECMLHAGMEDAADIELALLNVLVAQSYALQQSLALGLTPDRPNTAGVVNRVVQGVIIHPWQGERGDVSRR